MKILTTNFLTCAVRTCRPSPSSYPLHFHSCTLTRNQLDFSALFITNILPRLDYTALTTSCTELDLMKLLPEEGVWEKMVETVQVRHGGGGESSGSGDLAEGDGIDEEILKKLHTLLLEMEVKEGVLRCGNCGFEYPVKEGVGNFLLPSHLV